MGNDFVAIPLINYKLHLNLWHLLTLLDMVNVKGKGKVIPVQAWTGPDGSRRSRLPDVKTIGT